MAEGKIDTLKIKDFSLKPRTEESFIGEDQNAAIRPINPNDRFDMQRYREMDHLLGAMPEFGKPLADRTLIDDVRATQPWKNTKKTNRWMFGVVGTGLAPKEEIGELQGCIAGYQNEEVSELIKQNLLPKDAKDKLVLEITYVKKPDAPTHQMASAIRQVCTWIGKKEAAYYADDETSGPEFYITANIKKGNEDSTRAIEASGFEKKGSIAYHEGDIEYDFYVLNWEKLNILIHEKADSAKNTFFINSTKG